MRVMPSWWDTTFFIELFLLALAAPILYLPTRFPPLMLGVAFAFLAATWLWRRVRLGVWFVRIPAAIPIFFLFLVMLPIAIWAAPEPLRTTESWPRAYLLCWNFCLFWTVSTHGSRSYSHLQMTLSTMLILGIGIAVIGPLGANWLYKLPILSNLTPYIPNVLSSQDSTENSGIHPNTIAGLLLYILPLLILYVLAVGRIKIRKAFTREHTSAGFIHTANRSQYLPSVNIPLNEPLAWRLSVLLTGLVLMSFLLTQSRTGILALIVALLYMAHFTLHKQRFTVLATILIGLFFVPLMAPVVIQTFAGAPSVETMGGVNTLNFRENIWGRALLLIQYFPFTGLGLGTFSELVWLYAPPLESNITRIDHAHNFFLQTTLDLGLPGLMAVLTFLSIAMVQLYRVLNLPWPRVESIFNESRHEKQSSEKQLEKQITLPLIALGLTATFLGQIFFFQLDSISMGNRANFMFWLYLANVFALSNVAVSNWRPKTNTD